MTPLPDWLDPLYAAAEMRAVDEWAIEEAGVPSLDLMERAGLGLARATARAAGTGPVRIVVGKGNNGGDGLVAARILRAEGREVDVLAIAPLDELGGDAAANLERLEGEPPFRVRGRRSRRLGRRRRRAARDRLQRRAARAGRRGDRGDQRAGRAGRRLRRPVGRRGVDGGGGRRGRQGDAHRHLPRREDRPAGDGGRRALPARSRWSTSASRAVRPAPRRRG